jgi:type I restriction enzyme S subunit
MTPDRWSRRAISDLVAQVTTGVRVNSEGRPRRAGELGVLKTSAVTYGVFRPEENKAVVPEEAARAREHPRAGCVLFSRMNTIALVGASAYVADDREDLVLPDRIWQLRPTASSDGRWLHFVLSSPSMRARLSELASGTSGSMKNLSQEKLLTLELLAPPLAQQRKIAAILSSMDDAIEATQAVIDQLGVVKKAMMAELLTRGLPGQHTRFKQTEIGEVPETRESGRLHDFAKLSSGGTPSRDRPEFWGGGIPWVRTGEINYGVITQTGETISRAGLENSSAKIAPLGTLLLAMYGQGATRAE